MSLKVIFTIVLIVMIVTEYIISHTSTNAVVCRVIPYASLFTIGLWDILGYCFFEQSIVLFIIGIISVISGAIFSLIFIANSSN